jgi:hypothetical protein
MTNDVVPVNDPGLNAAAGFMGKLQNIASRRFSHEYS